MDLSKTLLVLLDIFFALMLLTFLAGLGFVLYVSFIDDMPFYLFPNEDVVDYEGAARLIFQSTSYLFFIAIVYYLRKGIRGMVRKHFFNSEVARNINVAGILLILVSITTMALNFLKDLFDGLLKLGMDPFDLTSEIFMVIIGLFLMLMARVIKEGEVLKSENELTI